MKVTGEWMSAKPTQALCKVLEVAGHQALFVGGCVRNALMGVDVTDIDIATDAPPETVMSMVTKAGMKAIPTGIDHGTLTVVAGDIPHEVTTFRLDVETTGRHAVVAYSKDIREDARRRDFTMNALYARSDGQLVDPLGGLPDLQARIVRFIENPSDRIKEDYLRILRFFRFNAWYGDPDAGLDADGLAACAKLADGLDELSRERVAGELLKLLQAPDPAPAVAAMQHTGILTRILSGADNRALAPLIHLERKAGVSAHAIRRLAVLAPQDVETHLRLSNAHAKRFDQVLHDARSTIDAGELGYRRGIEEGLDALLVRAAFLEQPLDPNAMTNLTKGANAQFPVRAKDLMPALEGPQLGARLKTLEQVWIASDFTLDRDALLDHPS